MLFFSDYLAQKKWLPSPPSAVSWSTKIASWPMMLNDTYGDCVEAGKGHMVMVFSTYGRGQTVVPSDSLIKNTYFAETGGQDTGLDIPTSLNYWAKNPLDGDVLTAWATIQAYDLNATCLAASLFGGTTHGVNLPQNCFDFIDKGLPWTDVSQQPDPNMGHDIIMVDYDSFGPVYITWGQKQKASWAWHQKYVNESYMLLGQDWTQSPIAPPGIALTDLIADFRAMGGSTPDPTPPSPVPPPAPPPQPAALFTLTVPKAIAKGRNVTFRAPVNVPTGSYSFVPVAGRDGTDTVLSELD